jgi:crotonobetainyl-CoA:carnitine CoA-transferase CaiB-like acyl-CoA transferase
MDLITEKHLAGSDQWLKLKAGDRELKVPKLPFQMQGTEAFSVREQPAALGEHTDVILGELGYSAADIAKLKTEHVVLRSDQMLQSDGAGR